MKLTCAEECQLAAKTFSAFAEPGKSAIPNKFVSQAMGIAIFKGEVGVAVVRLEDDWSAPCAILIQSPSGPISPGQETVLLFMTESGIFSLIGRTPLVFNQTHTFSPGPLYNGNISSCDVYCFVRYNNGFTPSELIQEHMNGWCVQEDVDRHSVWHGDNATWFDVLTNKISVDRSSVGNALYLVLNLGASGQSSVNNKANIAEWAAKFTQTNDTFSLNRETLPSLTRTPSTLNRSGSVTSASLSLDRNNTSGFPAPSVQYLLPQNVPGMIPIQMPPVTMQPGFASIPVNTAQLAVGQQALSGHSPPNTLTMQNQLQLQQMAQMPTQIQGQLSNQIQGQLPNHIQGQLPNQMHAQLPNQIQGQLSNQIQGTISNQIQGQISNQMQIPTQMHAHIPNQMQQGMGLNFQYANVPYTQQQFQQMQMVNNILTKPPMDATAIFMLNQQQQQLQARAQQEQMLQQYQLQQQLAAQVHFSKLEPTATISTTRNARWFSRQ
jgi:hypothetical protein